MLTGCPNIHGKDVVHCLRVKSFSIEVGKGGGDSLEALFVVFSMEASSPRTMGLGSMLPEFGGVSKTTECEFDLVLEFRRNGVLARSSPHLNLGGLELKVG